MKEIYDPGLMLFACALIVFFALLIRVRVKLESMKQKLAKRNEVILALKHYKRRYELLKSFECDKEEKFLELLKNSSYEDIDGLILRRLSISFNAVLRNEEKFVYLLNFVRSVKGALGNLLQINFISAFKNLGEKKVARLMLIAINSGDLKSQEEIAHILQKIDDEMFSSLVELEVKNLKMKENGN